jgi:hypothetical protein
MTERCNCDASCGENRYHTVGSVGCRFADQAEYDAYWKREQKKYLGSTVKKVPVSYERISIPSDVDQNKPAEWQMVLKVSEALEINKEFNKLKEDHAHMKTVLREILDTSKDPDSVRLAIKGLK